MLELNADNFEKEVESAEEVVMVDWWGPSCERCMELMPYVEELADKYNGQIKFASCNVQENRKMAIGHKVLGLPAIHFYKDGQKVDELSGGSISPEDVEDKIKKYC